jgi:hypothetical protein
MARWPILDYEDVLSYLEVAYMNPTDRTVSLSDIEVAFKTLTDKVRPVTIDNHIRTMCQQRLLVKRGELTYVIADNWKGIISGLKKIKRNRTE